MSRAAFTITSDPSPEEMRSRRVSANAAQANARTQMVDRQGRRFVSLAYAEAPKRLGKYAASITMRPLSGDDTSGFQVLSSAPLSRYILLGTRPHVIRAKNAPMLRFYWPKVGRVVYFKQVNHPGTKPNRFYNRALQQWLPGAREDLASVAKAWVVVMKGGQ